MKAMYIEAIIIGCVTGFISAFFGIGGSSIDTPLLRIFLHLPPYLALASPLPAALLTTLVALLTYWKKQLVDFRVFRWSILGGLPGMILGASLSRFFSGQILMLITAGVLFLVGVNFILKKLTASGKEIKKGYRVVPAAYITGAVFVLSALSGILANGGGLFLIPAYVLLFRMEMKKAIATSLLTVGVMILPAYLIHYRLGHIDPSVSSAMALGVIPMAYLGAKLDLKTKSSTIQLLFGLMLVVFSVYFFASQLKIS